MTTEQKQFEVATILGWSDLHGGESEGGMFLRGKPVYHNASSPTRVVPDFCHDLNAMFEAELFFNQPQNFHLWPTYKHFLKKLTPHPLHATAGERAEAFLKTFKRFKL